MKQSKFNGLPKEIKEEMQREIVKWKEINKPYEIQEVLKDRSDNLKWEKYKGKIIKEIRLVQYMERNKGKLQVL